jgi:hypothetical protein
MSLLFRGLIQFCSIFLLLNVQLQSTSPSELHIPGPSAAFTIEYGSKLNGAIGPEIVNTYTFPAAAGDTAALLLARTGGSGWTKADVYGPDGERITGCSGPAASKCNVKIERTGTHTIRVVEGFNGTYTYQYRLSLLRIQPIHQPSAVPIAFGKSITGKIEASMDALYFYGSAGCTLSISVARASGNGWTRFELYGPDAARITDQTSPSNASRNVTLTQTGQHTILLSEGFNGTYSYEYRVALEKLGGTCLDQQPPLRFYPVRPCRVGDTRLPSDGPELAANSTRSFAVPQSNCGIPATAHAYSLNVTVVPRSPLGFLTIWPTGQPRPWVSTLNSPSGKIVSNAAIVPAGAGGSVDVYVTGASDVILDINGYFTPPQETAGLMFYPVRPCRISDTRETGPTPTGGSTRNIPVQDTCGIPSTALAYSLNVTAVPRRPLGYLTLWPSGQTQPHVSTLNSPDGSIVAVAAIVPAGARGEVSFFVTDPADVVLDINGYFAPPGSTGLNFYTMSPCRVCDTRGPVGQLGGPILAARETRTFPVNLHESCKLPTTAEAYSLNATVVPTGPLWYLTLWPTGEPIPFVSTLNSPLGLIVANAALVPAGAAGSINTFVTNETHLILDANGYFAP